MIEYLNDSNGKGSCSGSISSIAVVKSNMPKNFNVSSENSENRNFLQAYAILQSDEFTYYMQKLQITLGRSFPDSNRDVDLPLGSTKIISRIHARIQYNFVACRFEMIVYGKNGAYVDNQFYDNNSPAIPLQQRSVIQIGEKCFSFILPSSYNRSDIVYFDEEASSEEIIKEPSNIPIEFEEPLTNTPLSLGEISTNNLHLGLGRQYGSVNLASPSSSMEQIDDNGKSHQKPPYSYASLIAQAINAVDDKKITLSGIYEYIMTKYPYYRYAPLGWQNSIRHNLSLNKAFVRVPKCEDAPGKGAFWTIHKDFEMYFRNDGHYKCKRGKTLKTSSKFQQEVDIRCHDVGWGNCSSSPQSSNIQFC